MNYYAIIFDREPGRSYSDFHDALVAHSEFECWWHFQQSCYIVGTPASVHEISAIFDETAEEHNIEKEHVVLAVDLSQAQGWQTKDAWKWINDNAEGQGG